ncbi:MAG: PorV/PorQ family protein [Candidatus Latescibacterota bacterium]
MKRVFMRIAGGFSLFAMVICCSSLFPSTCLGRSINDGIGTTGFVWLKAVSDAEVSAAGECIAARDGTAGILVHPAAIVTGLTHGTAKMSYVSHFVDTQYGTIGYANKIKDHYMGFRITYVNYGDFIATNSTGDRMGSFTAGDMGISFNMGKQAREDLKVGATVSYLTSKIQDFTAQAATIDLGAIYTPPFEGLTVGAMLMNVGKVFNGYSSEYTDKLPIYLTVGLRKTLQHSPFSLLADVTFPNDSDISYAFGIEANINDRFFLFGGTRSRSDVDLLSQKSKTNFSGIRTIGFGLNLDRYRFSYAYCPNNDLDNVHKITMSAQIF